MRGPVVLLFIALRSGPGKKNARYRAQARRTFLSPTMTHLTAPFAYKFFVDGPCCDDEGNDVISRKRTNADVKSGLVRREFNGLYGDTNYKNQWGSARVSNYGRDWDVSIVSWAAHNYRFSFILSTDDDALICTQNLLFQLEQFATQLSPPISAPGVGLPWVRAVKPLALPAERFPHRRVEERRDAAGTADVRARQRRGVLAGEQTQRAKAESDAAMAALLEDLDDEAAGRAAGGAASGSNSREGSKMPQKKKKKKNKKGKR